MTEGYKIHWKDILLILYVIFCFYGIPYIASLILPKWFDMIIGFGVGWYLIYRGMAFYATRYW